MSNLDTLETIAENNSICVNIGTRTKFGTKRKRVFTPWADQRKRLTRLHRAIAAAKKSYPYLAKKEST